MATTVVRCGVRLTDEAIEFFVDVVGNRWDLLGPRP